MRKDEALDWANSRAYRLPTSSQRYRLSLTSQINPGSHRRQEDPRLNQQTARRPPHARKDNVTNKGPIPRPDSAAVRLRTRARAARSRMTGTVRGACACARSGSSPHHNDQSGICDGSPRGAPVELAAPSNLTCDGSERGTLPLLVTAAGAATRARCGDPPKHCRETPAAITPLADRRPPRPSRQADICLVEAGFAGSRSLPRRHAPGEEAHAATNRAMAS